MCDSTWERELLSRAQPVPELSTRDFDRALLLVCRWQEVSGLEDLFEGSVGRLAHAISLFVEEERERAYEDGLARGCEDSE